MGTVTKTIGSAGGRDYSTIASWVSSLPANLVTDGNAYVGSCYNDSEFTISGDSNPIATISGHTTNSTNTITLTTASGQSFADNANAQSNALTYNQSNGVGLNHTGNYTATLIIGDNNVFLKKLQINATGRNGPLQGTGSGTITVSQCICIGAGSVAIGINGTGSWVLQNCLFVIESTSPFRGNEGSPCSITAENCTIVKPGATPSATCFSQNYGYNNIIVKNCAVFGFSTFNSGGATFSGNNNATDLASAVGTSAKTSLTYANQFQNTGSASPDFRTLYTADLIGAGATDANITVDIVGTSRPQGASPDIGCWEAIAPPSAYPRNGDFFISGF